MFYNSSYKTKHKTIRYTFQNPDYYHENHKKWFYFYTLSKYKKVNTYIMAKESILNKKSIAFLEKYLNNAAPTGYEWEGQKIWMDYLKPYVDEFITDTYGTAVGCDQS